MKNLAIHNIEDIFKNLKQKGLRISSARKEIIHFLYTEHGPFTAEEIFNKIAKKFSGETNLTSVYRTVQILEEFNLVRSCNFDSSSARYEWIHEDHHHHHIICRSCKKIETVPGCYLIDNKLLPKTIKGYKMIDHKLDFYGLCPDCNC